MGDETLISWAAPSRFGPAPHAPRDGDKAQARQRINVEVRTGRRHHPNTLPCMDCGHVWSEGERRHEYHHHNGYGPDHHYDVIPLCTECHASRDGAKAQQTHCINGHEFTSENTGRRANGNRFCRECRRIHDRNRGRDAAYWREYRAKRKSANG